MEHPYLLNLHIINQLGTEIGLGAQNEYLLQCNTLQNPFSLLRK